MNDEKDRGKNESKEAYWHNQFKVWEESGLSISEYCEVEGLSRSSFGYWRHKLLSGGKERSLVELKPGVRMNGDLIHILLSDATELGIPSGSDVEYVARLVEALKGSRHAG